MRGNAVYHFWAFRKTMICFLSPALVILESHVKVEPPSAWGPLKLSGSAPLEYIKHVK